MKVMIQTIFTPPLNVYDTNSPNQEPSDGGIGRLLLKFLNPVVAVTDDNGNALYQTNSFYTPIGMYGLMGAGLLIGYFFYRRYFK